ncbi:hypothetical protein JTE90_004691 [Oedothorax gibbosus]|uniref:HTH CENPB-type domain-containing protein n=1 Tax=Oedothorax gibbosus TaxID=931172 RepID=A0AAV6UAL9_9ARAC|nr:hypothetical protein JTE90_004691 [Oedothorax gibbosus]
MGKRKSAKPQKYVQPSEDEDDDNVEMLSEGEKSENSDAPVPSRQIVSSEKNSRLMWTKEKPPEDPKKENNCPINLKQDQSSKPAKDTVESEFWASHFPIPPEGVSSSKPFDFHHYRGDPEPVVPRAHSSPLETLLSERIYNSTPFLEERLGHSSYSLHLGHSGGVQSGTESDRRSGTEGERRGSRPKRRRKYVTYPATFRLEVVEHAERFGKSSAAKKYNICVEKVSMWCKTKDNIVHKVKKGGQTSADGSFDTSYDDRMEDLSGTGTPERDDGTPQEDEDIKRHMVSQELEMLYNDDSDEEIPERVEPAPMDCQRRPEVVYPAYFKHRLVRYAEKKGQKEAALEFKVCEKRLAVWCAASEYLAGYVSSHRVEEWEVDLYVTLKRLLEQDQVTVRDLIVRAEQAQLGAQSANSTISTAWLTEWCSKFHVCFKSVMESTPQPLTEHTCLVLETSLFQVDRDEAQMAKLQASKQPPQVQQRVDCGRTLDASSDREDSPLPPSSFSFSSKRRRRSYTLAFKLEVVKFAQTNTKHATSRKYGIARRVISRWIADKESLQTDLMNATQHALADSVTEEIDLKLLQYYKDLKKKGVRVSKDMVLERASVLFEQQQKKGGATNGWYKHWLVKCKERGESMDIAETANPTSSSNLQPTSDNPLPLDLHTPKRSRTPPLSGGGSSMDALKQAYMTNAILSSMRPTEMDLHIMSQFPELLNLIQQNPAILQAAHLQSPDLYRQSLQQAVVSLATGGGGQTLSKDSNGVDPYSFGNSNGTTKVSSSTKKRRERYSPDFKLMVIDYAASHSYQETSRKFGVHHITVSEWCKDKERIHKKVYCDNLQTLHTKILKSETAEQKFLAWIQDCNKAKLVIKPADVQSKANEILNLIGEAEVKKNCWWFYLWNKRGSADAYEDEDASDVLEKESRVNYPPAVKVEIAKVAERQSVNCAARCFRVARKRIREWVKCKDKLRWLAETGQVRERGGSFGGKKVNCLDVDKEVYEWYSAERGSPQLPEIRAKALQIFQKHGFSNMKCSREWYRNWCRRYGICRSPGKDSQLIRWILTRYDKNLPITHQELVDHTTAERAGAEEDAEEYVHSFCRRYPRLLEALPGIAETFPEEMEAAVAQFRVTLKELQEENGFSSMAIGCMDEVPLLFPASGPVIVNSGMSSWNAVVVLSCLADGQLLPPLVVVKGAACPLEGAPPHVLFQEEGRPLVDGGTVRRWVEEVWLPAVPSPSLLLLDCFQPHVAAQEAMLEAGVTPVLLPEGCASKLQPLNACITRHFQEAVQDVWKVGRTPGGAQPSPVDMVRCVLGAFQRLQDRSDVVRRSFVVTGVAVAPDGSDTPMIENADWFGCSGDEHVLSPASDSEPDSDLDA